ncbi:DUF427 domain-containing protein [Dermatobacter hominis]|uniref:DUF427 domain-containing protein n=1 Tax=Dermatobacter hominis TaxID=2884263 RepID=UPI001D11892C|nr:DUF427 domain-containing protein [Dermatobacter hominis]UDY36674.1 DUF427 domain-containing protein [Dermatobacter hominis]
MSLTHVRGPLGTEPAGSSSPALPDGGTTYVEPHPRRIRGVVDGVAVIDTERALLVHRPGRTLQYAFPADAVADLPSEPAPLSPGFVTVPWDAVDTWTEEGRELVHYPPNPYHRVDCRPGDRRLRVEVAGEVLVDADRTVALFETGLAPRLYVEPGLVRTDLLRRSSTSTYCNYKGWATYWDAVVDGSIVADVAWSYEEPLAESTAIAGHLSFDAARAAVVAELPG